MCSLLKNQACDLEKTLIFCDSVKEELGLKHEQNDALIQVCTAVVQCVSFES